MGKIWDAIFGKRSSGITPPYKARVPIAFERLKPDAGEEPPPAPKIPPAEPRLRVVPAITVSALGTVDDPPREELPEDLIPEMLVDAKNFYTKYVYDAVGAAHTDVVEWGQLSRVARFWWARGGHHGAGISRESPWRDGWRAPGGAIHPSRHVRGHRHLGTMFDLAVSREYLERLTRDGHTPEFTTARIYDVAAVKGHEITPIREVGGVFVSDAPRREFVEYFVATDLCEPTCVACFKASQSEADYIARSSQPIDWKELRDRLDTIEAKLGLPRPELEEALFGFPKDDDLP